MSNMLERVSSYIQEMTYPSYDKPSVKRAELAERTTNRRSKAALGSLSAVSATGIAESGGFIYHLKEKDRAWADQFARDETILEMSNNPILGGVLRQIAMFIRQVPWTLEAADESQEAKDIKDRYQKELDNMDNLWPGETMPQLLSFLTWGWAVLEIVYKQNDDGTIGWKEWRLIPQETRWRWIFDESGEATHIVQYDPRTVREIPIPLSKCIHIRDTSRGNSPEGFTLLRIIYDAYFYRNGFQQLEGTLFERYGGVQIARMPADDIENETKSYQRMQQIVTTLGVNNQSGLILASDKDPSTGEFFQDFKIEAPASGATVPSADPIINRYANEMVGVFGAAVTRTGQDGSGSYALADVQSDVFLRNMVAYLDLMRDCIQTQAFPRLAQMPYNNFPLELLPKLKHGRLDQVKLKDLGAYLVSLAQSGTLFDNPELREYVHAEASLPIPPVEEVRKKMKKDELAAKKAQQAPSSTPVDQTSSQDGVQKGTKIDAQTLTKSQKVTPQNLSKN